MAKTLIIASLLFLEVFLGVACGKINRTMDTTTDGINSMTIKMQDLNNKIDYSNEKIRQQALLLAKNEMEKPKNTENLFPPLGMFLGGQAFASTATALELAELVFNNINEMKVPIDDGLKENGLFPPAVIDRNNHGKMIKLMEIRVVSAFAPHKLIEDLVNTQVINRGAFESSVFAILGARSKFTSEVFLGQGILNQDLTNPGIRTLGQQYIDELRYLKALPFQSKCVLKVSDFVDVEGKPSSMFNANDGIDAELIDQQIDMFNRSPAML